MKKLILFLLLFIFLIGCSKDSDSGSGQCFFVGKWCLWNTVLNSCDLLTLEFRSNGELYQLNTTSFNWKSSDCKTVDIIHKASGAKSGEYTIRKQTNDLIYIDIGIGEDEYHRL